MEVNQLLGERELGLEPGRSLLELGDAAVLGVELGLAAGLVPYQRLAAVEPEALRAPKFIPSRAYAIVGSSAFGSLARA